MWLKLLRIYVLAARNCVLLVLIEPDNFAFHTPHFIIYIQQSNTASLLPAPIGGAARIEQEKTFVVLVPGDMAVAVDYDASVGKFLPRDFFTVMGIAEYMHNANATMANHNFAFD